MCKRDVAFSWTQNQPAKAGNFRTDGDKLFSYNLVVGETREGKKILFDYMSGGRKGFVSMTTSHHVGAARQFADVIE